MEGGGDASYVTEELTPEVEVVWLAAWIAVLAAEASRAAVEVLLTSSGSAGSCFLLSLGRTGRERPRKEEGAAAAEQRRRQVPRMEMLCRWKISSSCSLSSLDRTKL